MTIAIAIVLGVACAHPGALEERLCTPGNYVFCRCKDKSEGTKLCSRDGYSFAKCDACDGVAEEVDPPPVIIPEDARPDDTGAIDPDTSLPPLPDAAVEDVADAGPAIPRPVVGEVLITEVMYDPSLTEPQQEWFELFNATTSPRMLNGLTLMDGLTPPGRTHLITSPTPLIIPGGAYMVLVRSKSDAIGAQVPATSIVYEYGTGLTGSEGILLANPPKGGISLLNGMTPITTAIYGSWFMAQDGGGGSSIQLKDLTQQGSTEASSWCLSANLFGTLSDKGTPGAKADCP